MNRLATESSPYLRQHAANPVDWYPWGPEALGRAEAEQKPILLSIGYSACHWCHVMERESFSDPDVAAVMNRDFINIKVDREERPDLDEIYMQAVQMFTGGHGGWPMTVFLRPDRRPFLAGTYFPPQRRGPMPSFAEVLRHASESWTERRSENDDLAARVVKALSDEDRFTPKPLRDDALARVADDAAKTYDEVNGGLGHAPKFPPHGAMLALLAHHHRTGDRRSLAIVEGTLDGMIKGGTWDHVGGGLARYSTDERWLVPHFEKMLYDQGQLVPVLVDAWKATRNPTWRRIAQETLGFVRREMMVGDAFASALDADSEHVEGKFYVWTPAELRAVFGEADGSRAAALLGVTEEGSFEGGSSVVRLERPLERMAPADAAFVAGVLPRLLEAREARVRPMRDDKVLTSWNGLMISAFARAGAAFGDADRVDTAARAATWLLEHHRVDGRLLRTGRIGGFLDDHAFLAAACLDLWEATYDRRWLVEANALADVIDTRFRAGDGLSYVDGESDLIVRPKKLVGGAEPSAHGVAALVFLRLGALCGRNALVTRAESVLAEVQSVLERAPRAVPHEAIATAWVTGGSQEIGIVGGDDDPRTADLLAVVRSHALPFAVTAVVGAEGPPPEVPWMANRPPLGQPTAYVCEGHSCQLPTSDPAALDEQIRALCAPKSTTPRPEKALRLHAPQLPKDGWIGSPPIALADLRGHVVVLDFWAYCCINCQHVLPELDAIERRYEGRPVVVIGVHSAKFTAEQDGENVARAVARHRIRHAVVNDAERRLWERYAVRAWPTVVVLDAEGRIAWQRSGEVTRDELAEVIDGLLAEPAVAPSSRFTRPTPSPASTAFCFPGKISAWTAGSEVRVYVADSGNHRVLECGVATSEDGWPSLTTLRAFGGPRGFEDGPAGRGRFDDPQGVSRNRDSLYVCDLGNHAVRVVNLGSGAVRTIAGTGRLGRSPLIDPSKPRQSDLRSPWDVVASDQAVLVAMAGTHQIYAWIPGEIGEPDHFGPFVGSGAESHQDGTPDEAALAQPSGLAVYGRWLFWVDSETSSVRLMDLAEHTVHTVLGEGLFDFGDVDGQVDQARLQHPLGIAFVDRALYVADTYNGKIKRVDMEHGAVTTIAAGLCEPGGLCAVDGFLLVADTGNHRIVAVRRSDGAVQAVTVTGAP